MATRHSDRFSPPSRRSTPPPLNSHSYQSRNKAHPPPTWDRYSRDRSFPPSRHYSPYDEHENDQNGTNSSYRQSYPPPRHHSPYDEHENDQNGTSSSYRPSHPPPLQPAVTVQVTNSSQGPNRKAISSTLSTSNVSHHKETPPNSDTSSLRKTSNPSSTAIFPRPVDPTKDQEEIFKKMLEAVTDITQLKVDSAKAAIKLEVSRQKYEKNNCHYAKFPIIKSTLQSEFDKARIAVEQLNDKMARRDATFQELAGQSLPILLPAIQACELETYSRNNQNSELFKTLEKAIVKIEQQYSDLQQEFKLSIEEQKAYKSMKDKQYSSLEVKLQEMISADLGRKKENSELRSQLRSLSDEFSTFKKEILASRQEIKKVGDIAEFVSKDIARVEKRLSQSDKKYQEKFDNLEARTEPLSSMNSSIQTLLENGLHEVKASTLNSFSTTLNAVVRRIDSLPNSASYSSLNCRLENLEKSQVPESLWTQVYDLIGSDCDNRLKALESKANAKPDLNPQPPPALIALQDQVEALAKQYTANPSPPTNQNELSSLRSLTEGLQKSLNVMQINISSLHKRLPPNSKSLEETKSSTNLNDLNRKITELTTIFAGTNHSLENLTARVDNMSTGYLAQAILNQLSETYPHLQNFEHLVVAQGERLRELQSNVDHLSNDISRVVSTSQKQVSTQSQTILSGPSSDRNFAEEIDKLSEILSRAISGIKKLAAAADDDRNYISEKLESRLGCLVDSADLQNHKTELASLVKTEIQNGIEEYNKTVVVPQIEKVENLSEVETSIESRLKVSVTATLNEKNASTLSKMEESLSVLKKGLEVQITNGLQEQKKELEELVIAQVDRSLVSNRPDLVKEVAKQVQMKKPINEDNLRVVTALSRTNSPRATPAVTRSDSAIMTRSSTPITGHLASSSTTTEKNKPAFDSGPASANTRSGSQHSSLSKGINIDGQKKKRKLVNLRSASPRKTNGSNPPATKRVRRTPNSMGTDKKNSLETKSEED